MNLESILPRTLGESESDTASIFTSLIMAAHFERSRARMLGWRGVRPSASEHPAWTCRVAGSSHVFGIRFNGESHLSSSEEPVPCIRGWFDLYVFPKADDPILEFFPLAALQYALLPEYASAVRNFSGTEQELIPFRIGQLRMDAAFQGNALALMLEAPARYRVLSSDGIALQNSSAPAWLVAPGETECSLPSFRILLPFFAVLASTAEQQLGEQAEIFRGAFAAPLMQFHRNGQMEDSGKTQAILTLTASFGPSMSREKECLHRLSALPARYRHKEENKEKLPVLHVLTGFLGAGKTTFLRRWLDFLHGRERYTGVIQNEFGKVELDATLMKNDTVVEALDEGCVCCSLADSLRPGLERIIAAMPADQFILETTGLANPSNIMEALGSLTDIIQPGMVITIADALDLCRSLASAEQTPLLHGIRLAQILKADVIILNKSDMISDEELAALTKQLRTLNTNALLLPSQYGNIPFGELDAWIDAHTSSPLPSHRPQLMPASTHSLEGYEARCLEFEGPISLTDLHAILADAGKGLCRAKGIIEIEEKGICIVQYSAGQLEVTPSPGSEILNLVLIGTDLPMEPAQEKGAIS